VKNKVQWRHDGVCGCLDEQALKRGPVKTVQSAFGDFREADSSPACYASAVPLPETFELDEEHTAAEMGR
jgi:hypothetical protein